jgi:hypothetical protein
MSQRRGPITDTWPEDGGPATATCVHGKSWPENALKEPNGPACSECIAEWCAMREEAGGELYAVPIRPDGA